MTPALVPQIVHNSLLPIRRAVECPGGSCPPFTVQEMLDGCLFAADLVELLWNYGQERMGCGMERARAQTLLAEIRADIDLALATFTAVRDLAADATAETEPNDLASLTERIRNVEALRDKSQEFQRWLDIPYPRIDLAALDRVKTGEGENLATILARLRSGGDL
jgi:hypothetical protein